ncbi:MAG: pyruvate, phosphate dikinase [Rhodospirillales bacterium]|nr:pyruvate, phosphate dikinase [Rhodospirillales bacterium]
MGAVGRWVLFLDGVAQPDRALVGGKAWGIDVMRHAGLPVPPAFVVTTEACRAYLAEGALPGGLLDELHAGIAMLEAETGRRFGASGRPLLLAVRSGAAVSMPGMLDTVLNLGIDEEIETALAAESGDAAFARDTHRRFHEMYARIVLKAAIDGLAPDGSVEEWRAAVVAAGAAGRVPEAPADQLLGAVRAVFDSWNGRRAKRYRRHHGLPDDAGTAVTVQAMVFGNLGENSGTGVLFSRNPLTGAPAPYGEYLARAQGEDVVSGQRTPQGLDALASSLPEAHAALIDAAHRLEALNRDVQDIEFSVQEGALYLLQTRTAARSPAAAVCVAVDLVNEGTISTDEALARVSAAQVRLLLMPRLDDGAGENASLLAEGEGASPGVGIGKVVLDADAAEARGTSGEDVVLVRPTTSPDDVHGMVAARAVVTATGGATSHAAVVSRSLGVPCVVGCGAGVGDALAGREVTVDGKAGEVFDGALPVSAPAETDDPQLCQIADWARAAAPLAVYRADEAAQNDALELDRLPGGEDPERLPELLQGVSGASGGALASDAGVAAAVAAGLDFIVVRHALPALLAACAAARAETVA